MENIPIQYLSLGILIVGIVQVVVMVHARKQADMRDKQILSTLQQVVQELRRFD